MMPGDGLDRLRAHDAICLGAVGWPGVPDHVSLRALLIPIRRAVDQYASVRPVRLLRGVESPLAGRGPADIDFVVVCENVEGEQSEIGGRLYAGTAQEMAVQKAVFTRRGTDRIMDHAFELARGRPRRHVTSATKSDGIVHTMPFWDERFRAAAERHPDVATAQYHISIPCAHFVARPDWFDVVVGSNLSGDILSDMGPGWQASSASRRRSTSTPSARRRRCASPCTARRPTSRGRAWPTRWRPCGRRP